MRYPKEIPYISGVGADDTFILVKSWRAHSKMDPNSSSLEDHLESMVDSALSHSILTMCVTSLTTAAAFFASFISTITAIKCFRQVYYLRILDMYYSDTKTIFMGERSFLFWNNFSKKCNPHSLKEKSYLMSA